MLFFTAAHTERCFKGSVNHCKSIVVKRKSTKQTNATRIRYLFFFFFKDAGLREKRNMIKYIPL